MSLNLNQVRFRSLIAYMHPTDLIQNWRSVVTGETRYQSLSETNFVWHVTGNSRAFILKEVGKVNPQGKIEDKLAADFEAWTYLHSRGIPVALPIPTGAGQPWVLVDGQYYSLFPELPSRPDPESPLEQVQANIGAAIARLHRALADYPGPIHSWTMRLPERIFNEALGVILRYLNPDEKEKLEEVLNSVKEPMLRALSGLPTQFIHGDCHGGNILLDGVEVSGLIDLDHMPTGPRLYDLSYYLNGPAREIYKQPEREDWFFKQVLPAFLKGYQSVTPLQNSEKEALPYLMMGVDLIMAGWFFEPSDIPDWARENLELFVWTAHRLDRFPQAGRREVKHSPVFDTRSAIEFARQGRLEEWIHHYLNAGFWRNTGLSDGLKRQRRWWRGPIELPLSALSRCVGVEVGMEYQVSEEYWEKRMADLTASIQASRSGPLDMPPLIASYDPGLPTATHLSVRDGNHRLGAYERLGWPGAYTLIWYNSEEEYRLGLASLVDFL